MLIKFSSRIDFIKRKINEKDNKFQSINNEQFSKKQVDMRMVISENVFIPRDEYM